MAAFQFVFAFFQKSRNLDQTNPQDPVSRLPFCSPNMVSMVFFLKMLKIILLKIGTFKIHLAQQKGKGNRVSKEKAMRPLLSLPYKSILGVNKGTASNRLIMPTSFFEKELFIYLLI